MVALTLQSRRLDRDQCGQISADCTEFMGMYHDCTLYTSNYYVDEHGLYHVIYNFNYIINRCVVVNNYCAYCMMTACMHQRKRSAHAAAKGLYNLTHARRLTLASPTHVGHGSFVYITMNPAVLSHSCAFPWLRM